MALTVTDDHILIAALDSGANQNSDGTSIAHSGSFDSNQTVKGGAGIYQVKSPGGVGTGGVDLTDLDIRDKHLYGWVKTVDLFNTKANNGTRLRIVDGTDFTTNFGEWTVGGIDTLRVMVLGGYSPVCVNVTRAFDFITGTPPARTLVDGFGIGGDMTTFSGQNTFFVDEFKTGAASETSPAGVAGGIITVTAGTNLAPEPFSL